MENNTVTISQEELDNMKRQIEGLKTTIEILQDKETSQEIKDNEEALRNGEPLDKVNF